MKQCGELVEYFIIEYVCEVTSGDKIGREVGTQ